MAPHTVGGTKSLMMKTNKENGMIIDLRKKELFETGHITGSKNIPSADFDNNSSDLDKHKIISYGEDAQPPLDRHRLNWLLTIGKENKKYICYS